MSDGSAVQLFPSTSTEAFAHLIQQALTPVFLLSGIAALLNVFSTRLGRVSDQVDAITAKLDRARDEERRAFHRLELLNLKRRSQVLDGAIILGAVGGVATSFSILTLFLEELRNTGAAWLLPMLFGSAIVCTIGALVCYCAEMLLAGRVLRARVNRHGG